jgi:hypothetical protein
MSDWKDFVGDFKGLEAPRVMTEMLKCIHKTALLVRQSILTAALEVDPEYVDPHSKSLSFREEKELEEYEGEDKKNKPKPKYTALVAVQEEYEDEETGKKKKRAVKGQKTQAEKNKAKWFTASYDFKVTIGFLLRRFVKEIKDFYVANGNKFPDESVILSEFETFGSQPVEIGQFNIGPFILGTVGRVNVKKWCEPTHSKIGEVLYAKFSDIFKNGEGTVPQYQLNKFVDQFVQFLKLIGVSMANCLYYKKLKVDSNLICMILRSLEVSGSREIQVDEMFYKVLSDWIVDANKLLEANKADKAVKAEATKAAKANAPSASTPSALEDGDEGQDISEALNAEEDTWADEVANEDE